MNESSKNKRPKRKSADGVWRTRTYGYVQGRGAEERLAVRLRRVRVISLAVGALVGLAAAGGIAYASYLPRFQIADINIRGQLALSEQMLRAAAESQLHDGHLRALSPSNIVLFSRSRLEQDLIDRFPRIRTAEATVESFEIPAIAVEIEERTPYARWCLPAAASAQAGGEASCFLLDEQGLVFALFADDALVQGTIFRGGMLGRDLIGKQFLPLYFAGVRTTIESLGRMGFNAATVTVVNDSEYHITLENGTRLLFRFADDPIAVMEDLKASLGSEALADKLEHIDYIDMRFEGRAYYKSR